MNNRSLLAAGALLLLANGLTLMHAARNRLGSPDSDIILTERELVARNNSKEQSGVELYLSWQRWKTESDGRTSASTTWLDRQKLSQLGFDCSVDPSTPASQTFYSRQRARRKFVALEYRGSASQAGQKMSQLVIIDADSDPVALRRSHPDRHSVMILPAVVRINRFDRVPLADGHPWLPARIEGSVELFNSIHVPRPFRDKLLAHRQSYRVHLRVGSLYEPWVTDVTTDVTTDVGPASK
jgi:hypothetical protein